MEHWRHTLHRWTAAGLIDAQTSERIIRFEEQQHAAPETTAGNISRQEWPVLIALIFGGIALGAGFLLLVASHWDALSPRARFAMVIAMVLVLHLGGIVAADSKRFRRAFHMLGSIAFGAAVFLTGEIFPLPSPWAHGMSWWALGTLVSWFLLRDVPQTMLLAILAPIAFGAEYGDWIRSSGWKVRWEAQWATSIALTYLSAVYANVDSPGRMALVWVGAVGLLPGAFVLGASRGEAVPLGHVLAAAVAAVAVAVFLRRKDWWMNALFACWAIAVAEIPKRESASGGTEWLVYLLYAAASGALVWWGLREGRPERVNFGVAGFALTVLCFYVSSFFDRIGRSESLIGLGVLLLAGGWILERTRRNLLAGLGKERL